MDEASGSLNLAAKPWTLRGLRQLLRNWMPGPVLRALRLVGLPALVRELTGSSPLYETDVCAAFERVVQPGWICADVGANVGTHTELLAKLVGPRGRVVAFEAHPDNARTLRERFGHGPSASRVQVENVIVSDGSVARLPLFPGRRHSRDEWNIVGHDLDGQPTQSELELPATSLDQYFDGRAMPNLVKIDVEGAESLVLAGMRRILSEADPIVIVEFHNEETWRERSVLLDAGYRLFSMEGRPLPTEDKSKRLYHVIAKRRSRSNEPAGSPRGSVPASASPPE